MSSPPTDSLGRLEELVANVSTRLRELAAEREELRADRSSLQERVEELERQLEGADWSKERQALVERVERLIGGLDEVIAASGAGAPG